jgi:hypothetical protein
MSTGPAPSAAGAGAGASAGAGGAGADGGVAGGAAVGPSRGRSGCGVRTAGGVRSIAAATVERSKGGAALSAGRLPEVASAPKTRSQR